MNAKPKIGSNVMKRVRKTQADQIGGQIFTDMSFSIGMDEAKALSDRTSKKLKPMANLVQLIRNTLVKHAMAKTRGRQRRARWFR